MEAGLELFGTIGYQRTTIPMICTAAGVTARHFYEEYSSREALLRALYDQIADTAYEQAIGALRMTETDVRERIHASNVGYYGYLTSDLRIARIYALESASVSPEFELHRRAKRETMAKRLTKAAQWVEERQRTDVDSRLISVALAGAARDLVLEWVLAPRRPSVDRLVDTITTIWIRALHLERADESVTL